MFIFDVKVMPGSNKLKWELGHVDNSLICYHKTPDDSKLVNTEIINSVAAALSVTHGKIHLVQGTEDRHKKIKVSEVDASYQKMLAGLGLGK